MVLKTAVSLSCWPQESQCTVMNAAQSADMKAYVKKAVKSIHCGFAQSFFKL